MNDRPRFRDSAAVVLVRGEERELEVYWARRSDQVSFMPGFHAFIGGVVGPDDASLPIDGARDEREHALQACAIRETFEEIGVLIASGGDLSIPVVDEARERLLAGEARFTDLARAHGWTFSAADLVFAGRWQTPPFSSARFDTTFFLSRNAGTQEPALEDGELADGEWIRPTAAIERWQRGEAIFAAPILHTLEELAKGEAGLLDRLATAPERAGQPPRRIELSWGIVLHPTRTKPLPPATHTNTYFVGDREVALIDPGSADPAELDSLFTLATELERDGRRVTTIVLTHHHPDHVAGVEAARERFGVPVATSTEYRGDTRIDRRLEDGAMLRLAAASDRDWELRVLLTPGHTRDHLCLFHERTGALFTGDHVVGGGGTVIIDPPDGDMTAYIASLERLLTLPLRTLFPGHGSPQGAAARRIRQLIAHRREREERVKAALEPEPQELGTLVERAYADTPRELWGHAQRSLLAHLLKLEVAGLAKRDGERWRRT